ncbi:tripartite tricarboxylate transporter TctB family protein [Roseobacter sp. YSTF-M11]|uniref:Tripartite tricarboxylate transporter TctB family protein n=1 Tax=Roseobacter insulae TaxID=2859783 RepID=A0A9X1JZT9_9RHOB|nr:tripartite tricarboxylate transporter TctB family protein [Roseobacter insulae]MBW4709756.1 tripartite tricarboxylate transporter TctB family protein [Roseobacter insulae]
MTRFAVPCGIVVFCLVAYWLSTQFDRVPPILLRGMQPADFPQMVLLLIMALSVLVMIFDKPIQHEPMGVNVWTSLGLFVVFALLAQVDMFLGLGVFAGALAFAWGERRILGAGLVAIVSPTLIFLLFDMVFRIRFPRGLLTNLWYG